MGSDRIPYLTNMKLFAIVCLALIAAANAAPQGGSFTTLLMTDIAGARASAAEIALAGGGLDQLEKQLQAFSADAAKIKRKKKNGELSYHVSYMHFINLIRFYGPESQY